MTARSRPPTDQQKTAVYDPERDQRGRIKPDGIEIGTPTEVTPQQDHSEPIRVISLKAPGSPPERERSQPVRQHEPRLRQLSEVVPARNRAATPPGGLGYLAPPRDPREARTRKWRDYVLWGSVAVILAGAVTLGVWFIAGM
jgi:hypothetical protein